MIELNRYADIEQRLTDVDALLNRHRGTGSDVTDFLGAVAAADLVQAIDAARRGLRSSSDPAASPYERALDGAPDEVLRAALMWCQHRQFTDDGDVYRRMLLESALLGTTLTWNTHEVAWLVQDLLTRSGPASRVRWVDVVVNAAETLTPDEVHAAAAELNRLRAWMTDRSMDWGRSSASRLQWCLRLDAVLGAPDDHLPEALFGPLGTLQTGRWHSTVHQGAGPALVAAGVPPLLRHAATSNAVRTSHRWLRHGQELLAAAPTGSEVLRQVLQLSLQHPDHPDHLDTTVHSGNQHRHWVDAEEATLMRGLVQLTATLPHPWVTSLLEQLLAHTSGCLTGTVSTARSIVVANATITAVAQRPDAVSILARASTSPTHRLITKHLSKTLQALYEGRS